MAKKTADVASIDLKNFSTKVRDGIAGLKKTVAGLAKDLAVFREKALDAAPRLMKVFKLACAENDDLKWIDFVRLFDPTVPAWPKVDDTRGPGYQAHKTFNAMQYMKRLEDTKGRRGQKNADGTTQVRGGAADTLAAILGMVAALPGLDMERIYTTIKSRANYSDKALNNLKRRVERVTRIADVEVSKGEVHIVRVHAAPATETEPAEPMARGGQAVDLENLKGRLAKSLKRQPRKLAKAS